MARPPPNRIGLPLAPPAWPRRRLLESALGLPLAPLLALAGCASPWPDAPAAPASRSASDHLQATALAGGARRWQSLRDLNLQWSGSWWADAALRPAGRSLGSLQMRLARPHAAQATVALAANIDGTAWQVHGLLQSLGAPRPPSRAEDTAGPQSPDGLLLADLHRWLLAAPLLLADFAGAVSWAEPQTLDGLRCDHLQLTLAPGLGHAPADRLSLFIDREKGWVRRLRVSLSALAPGRWLDVACNDHISLGGIVWPTHWQANALNWQLVGLDLDRGYPAEALSQTPWAAPALAPARPLPPA